MNKKELSAAQELLEVLEDYYDDSALQLPIKVGDRQHVTICDYRKAFLMFSCPTVQSDFAGRRSSRL